MKQDFIIYSLTYCPYCVRAKQLLDSLKIPFTEFIAEEMDQDELQKVLTKSQMRTFPQIFYKNKLIGGFTELKALNDKVGILKYIQDSNE
jgi:glutaredoxin 3